MMTREAEARKLERIDAVAEHLRSRHVAGSSGLAEAFIHQYYDRVLPEDVIGTSPDSLYASAYALWKFGQTRRQRSIPFDCSWRPPCNPASWSSQ